MALSAVRDRVHLAEPGPTHPAALCAVLVVMGAVLTARSAEPVQLSQPRPRRPRPPWRHDSNRPPGLADRLGFARRPGGRVQGSGAAVSAVVSRAPEVAR